MKISIPNSEALDLNTLILDLNGTLTVGGQLVPGVTGRIEALKLKGMRIILFTGNTRGTGAAIAEELGIELVETASGEDKKHAAESLDPTTCVTIGNGLIDLHLFKKVKLSIATIQGEGVHTATLMAADIAVTSIVDALDLLIDEQRLIATLRP